jgi:hypothetical protein
MQGLTLASITQSKAMIGLRAAWANLVVMAGSTAAAIGIVTLAVGAVAAAITTWTMAYQAWQDANREHQKSVAASGNFLDAYAKNVALGIHSMEEWRAKVRQVTSEEGLSFDEKAKLTAQAARLTQAMEDGSLAAEAEAEQQRALAKAHRQAAQEARKQWAAELSLVGGFLGIQGAAFSARDAELELAKARQRVIRLTNNGKKGTKEYSEAMRGLRDAELNAVESQVGLASAVADYIDEQKTGKTSQREITQQVREFARMAGLGKDATDRLIDSVRNLSDRYGHTRIDVDADTSRARRNIDDLKRDLRNIPDETVYINAVRAGVNPQAARAHLAAGAIIAGASGFVTKGPTYLVGESARQTFAGRGAEAVIPLDQRGIAILGEAVRQGMAASRGRDYGGRANHRPEHVTINLHVDGMILAKTVTRHQKVLDVLLESR